MYVKWHLLLLCVGFIFNLGTCDFQYRPVQNGRNSVRTKYTKYFGKNSIKYQIENLGFNYENYTVITDDGFILNLNRMVHPNRSSTNNGYPLLLVNGLLMHSEAWMVQNKVDSNLAAVFGNHGYDVWLGDQRGTMRSNKHIKYTPKDPEFYNYSFEESGYYDLASFADFVLEKTASKDLMFGCISQGCSLHAVLLSERPSYNKYIRGALYFNPLVNNIRKVSEMNSLISSWFKINPFVLEHYRKNGFNEFFPRMAGVRKETYHICRPINWLPIPILRLLYGSSIHMPQDSVCEISALAIGGGNFKSVEHVLQMYTSGEFAKFDYGREKNLQLYGQEAPPKYDMKKITSFVAYYYSDADVFESPEGVERSKNSLGGPSYLCELPNFNHLDIAVGTTFRYVIPDVLEFMDALSGKTNNTAKLHSGKCPSMEWIRPLED